MANRVKEKGDKVLDDLIPFSLYNPERGIIMAAIIREIGEIIKETMKVVTNADKAYKLLREWGYDYTRDVVRSAWKEVGEKESWKTVLQTWGPERTPPRYWATERKGGIWPGYMQIIEYTYRDIETGNLITEKASVVTDKPEPFSDVFTDLEDDLREYMVVKEGQLVSVKIGGMMKLTGPKLE